MAERERRKRPKHEAKLSAFERLKQVKTSGKKNKYEVGDVENVYDEISEKEYTERVLQRQDEDWIVGDGVASGYIEDGREIFDDDLDEESLKNDQKSKKRDRSGAHKILEAPKGNIQKMLANMASKKKTVKLDEDEALNSLMTEIADEEMEVKPTAKLSVRHPRNDVDAHQRRGREPPLATRNDVDGHQRRGVEPTPTFRNDADGHQRRGMEPPQTSRNDVDEHQRRVVEPPQASRNDINGHHEKRVEPESNQQFDDMDISEFDEDLLAVDLENIQNKNPETEKQVTKGWETLATETESSHVVSSDFDSSQIPVQEAEDGKKTFKFFYWDAFEDSFTQPGTVYLFGKVALESSNTFASCCITVKNIPRRVFFLPREKRYDMTRRRETDEDVKMIDVYKEFNSTFAEKHKIMKFKSRKVTKHYAFNIRNVPDTCEYLEVRYPATDYALPNTLQGETFSHVFGTNTGFLELFLIERKIKGPCWLNVVDPSLPKANASWCKVEFDCEDMNRISVCKDRDPPPPLVVMSLNIRAAPIPKSHDNQITMIGCLIHNAFHTDKAAPNPPYSTHLCLFTKPVDAVWPFDAKSELADFMKKTTKMEKCNSERELLSLFMAKYYKFDPDLIVGHDILGFDIGTLIHRLVTQKIQHWSRLGRLRRANTSNVGKGKSFAERSIMCGRLMCDVKIAAKELIRARTYELEALCEQVLRLKEVQKDVKTEEVKAMYKSPSTIIELINLTMRDAQNTLKIMYELNMLPLALQITNVAGNVLSRTLLGGRSERNEFLLLHAFNDKDYIVPDKVYGKKATKDDITSAEVGQKGKRKPQYEGGLVLEPKKGFYDHLILLMDFNSLYPSIIQEYNICFTTISVRGMDFDNEEDLMVLMEDLPSDKDAGILPTEIKKLVESRREVKKLMAAPNISDDLRHQYNIRQMALKLTANSMYGCLGFPNSRFYAKPLAAMVTAKGREILMNTRDLVQKLNYDVIYGDTDSLMINTNSTNYDDVFNVGNKIKTEVNKLYRRIELDIDGVFKYMLLLKKKKYAAVTMSRLADGKLTTTTEIKGLDIVRRDWSKLSAETGKFVLDQILSDKALDDKISVILAKLGELKAELEDEQKVNLAKLAITKQLTKNPEDYPDRKALPHVQVAIRMNSTLAKKLRQGDTISYVICEDGTNNSAIQRAYHVNEYEARKSELKIDVKYYLSQQIHPVISRLCEPLDGIDGIQIAEALGLDSSAYQHIRRTDTANDEDDEIALDDTDKYKNCENFTFQCFNPACGVTNVIESPVVKNDDGSYTFVLDRCINARCAEKPFDYATQLQNMLWMKIRSYVKKYYAGWMYCDDPTCQHQTRNVTLYNKHHEPECSRCRRNKMVRVYSESQLFHQLCYFQYMFDISNAISKNRQLKKDKDDPSFKAYLKLKEKVDEALKINAYNIIDLRKICDLVLTK